MRGAPLALALPLLLAFSVLPPVASAATHVVKIEGMAFAPATLTVKRGDTVVWENKDVVPHTVTAAGQFDSKAIDAGSRWSWTAGGKGPHDYVCTFHSGMKATVVVEE